MKEIILEYIFLIKSELKAESKRITLRFIVCLLIMNCTTSYCKVYIPKQSLEQRYIIIDNYCYDKTTHTLYQRRTEELYGKVDSTFFK